MWYATACVNLSLFSSQMSLDKAIAFAAKREPKRRVTLVRPQDETGLPYYLQTMVDLVTETVYRVVSHALFAKHQLLFSFYLCVKIKLHTKDAYRQPTIEESEWNWFLHGGGSAILNEYRDDWSEDIEFTPRTGEYLLSQEMYPFCAWVKRLLYSFFYVVSNFLLPC